MKSLSGYFYKNSIQTCGEGWTRKQEAMNLKKIREQAIDAELHTITSGTIKAKTSTYTQNSTSNQGKLECVINAYYFEHPKYGGMLIDAGFSSDFYQTPPYGNLNLLMKFFQKLNGVTYIQSQHTDTPFQLKDLSASPGQVYLTHRHPDHTSAISQLPDQVSVSYGKGEHSFFYWLLTRKHLQGKRKQLIDFDQGFSFEGFDRAIDIFGDGSFLALSTKGHTKDHISYLLNGKKMYLIAGDAELTKEAVSKGLYVNSDYGKKGEKDARESAERIRAFTTKYPEVEVCYSHDI